jgi:hypothetical protein
MGAAGKGLAGVLPVPVGPGRPRGAFPTRFARSVLRPLHDTCPAPRVHNTHRLQLPELGDVRLVGGGDGHAHALQRLNHVLVHHVRALDADLLPPERVQEAVAVVHVLHRGEALGPCGGWGWQWGKGVGTGG